jgi:hypothetical protein
VKIYAIGIPDTSDYARILITELGYTLVPSPAPAVELRVAWEHGSSVIGDFTWVTRRWVVTDRVRDLLAPRVQGVAFFPVHMDQDPRLKRPTRVTTRTKKSVWLPDDALPLWEMWVTAWVHPDRDRSSLRVIGSDAETGRPVYDLDGVETIKSHWDKVKRTLTRWREPRVPGQGLYVRAADVPGAWFFRIYEDFGRLVCTEPVKDLLQQHEITNLTFLEYGETF